jgi:hypothetical protein
VIIGRTSNQEWAFLGGIMMGIVGGAIALLVFLVISIIQYNKKKSDYWLGVLYGYAGMIGFGLIITILSTIYNLIVG